MSGQEWSELRLYAHVRGYLSVDSISIGLIFYEMIMEMLLFLLLSLLKRLSVLTYLPLEYVYCLNHTNTCRRENYVNS